MGLKMKPRGRKTNIALKLAIIATGRTQRVIAGKARIGEVRLSMIVSGHVKAKPAEQARLAVVLDRPVAELFALAASPEPTVDDETKAVAS
jgi:hypothetical protein